MNICPTSALFRRRDGIVDLNGDSCIGCRACMAACPYDQLFIDPNTRTAEKCNFCANRVENKLEPACVSVCPTECRIFGDLDDPTSEVAQIVQREAFMVRKPEKGTGPEDLLSRRRRGGDPAGDRGAAVHVPRGPGAPAAARIAGSGSAAARRPARRLRRARTSRRGASTSCCTCCSRASRPARCSCRRCCGSWAIARRSSGSAGRSSSLIFAIADGRRARDRSRAARALLLHPDAAELDVVAGARRVPAHGARRHRDALGALAYLVGWTDALVVARAAGDGGGVRGDGVHRASSSRRAWRAISGRDRTARSTCMAQAAAEGSAAMLLVAAIVGAPARRRCARSR